MERQRVQHEHKLSKYYAWSNHSSGWGGDVVAIGGYAFGDFLPYAKGGVAWIDENYRLTPIYGAVASAIPGTSQTIGDLGWTLGAGLAYHVSSNWEVFGQYMYAKFGAHNINIAQQTFRASLAVNSITAGVNFKF